MARTTRSASGTGLRSMAAALMLAVGVSARALKQTECAEQGYSCRIRDCCDGFQCVTMDTGLGFTDYCQPATGPKLICFRGECKEPYYCPPMGAPGHDHSIHHSPFCLYDEAVTVVSKPILQPVVTPEIPVVSDPNAQTSFSSSSSASATSSSSGETTTDVTTSGPGASGEATASTTQTGGSDGVTEKTTCANGECVTTVTTCVDGTCTTVEKPTEGGSEAESDGGATAQPPTGGPADEATDPEPADEDQGSDTSGEASVNAFASATATNGTTTTGTTCDGTGCTTETTTDTADSPVTPVTTGTSDQTEDVRATVGATPPTSAAVGLLFTGASTAAACIAAAIAFVL